MANPVEVVRNFYDENVQYEWERLDRNPFEFALTTAMMERHIRPGDRVLDIGGGPGRYSLYFAGRGCDVTLLDLSENNVRFARQKAAEQGLRLTALAGDAREADKLAGGPFDHVFLMGPLYHLLEEAERIRAVEAALACLKPGGNLYASFILLFSGMIYMMRQAPEHIVEEMEVKYNNYIDCVVRDDSYGGASFTEAFFIRLGDVLPFMARFPLSTLHLFGQEGILAPCERNILAQPKEIVDRWVNVALQLCEREELLSFAEHVMYIGRKG